MRRNVKAFVVVSIILAISSVLYLGLFKFNTVTVVGSNVRQAKLVNSVNFFDETAFYEGISYAKENRKIFSQKVTGGIIPHHLFPSFMIADFFNRLSHQNPHTIIIIGPNHYEKGKKKVLTSLNGWKTPFGIVEPEKELIDGLSQNALVGIDDDTLASDHSVAGILPFVKHYIPEVRVIPILVSSFMTDQETSLLAQEIRSMMDDNTVLIASVDFSHYLVSSSADEKDNVTIELIKKHEYAQILSLGSFYLDSPGSIVVLLKTMKNMGYDEMDILHHTNSGRMQRNNSIETTSYYSIAFY